jgi:hypothetical protein
LLTQPSSAEETPTLRIRSLRRQRHIPRSSRRRSPEPPAHRRESPQRSSQKALLTAEIPAYPRSACKRHDRPVTPEVAGSSPVAPVTSLQIGILCCRFRRKRPLVSSSSGVHRARESPYEAGGSREFPQPMVPAGTTGGRFGVRRDSMRSLIDDSSLRWIPLHSVRPLRSPARPLPSAAAGLPLPASRATHPGGAAARSSSLT